MYKQKGVIDLKIPEILILGFTEEEENELLQRYIDQPIQKSGDQALQIMDEIVTLDKDITSHIARNFQHWSDRYSSQAVPLAKLTTKTSRFILDTEDFKTSVTDTWRFCVDYRKSNDYTKSASWPMPNVQQ
jgi:hypothetical protein